MNIVPGQPPSDWIFLYTPMHTGTHFARFLLELHPRVSFWRCDRTVVRGRPLGQWHRLRQQQCISFSELVRLATESPPDLPAWTQCEADRLGISIPAKAVARTLVHAHITSPPFWHPELRPVVTVRDPLLSVISRLRRGDSPEGGDRIVSHFQFLAKLEPERCFWFCTDLWKDDRKKALDLLRDLHLEPTAEIRDFVARWPVVNSTSHGNQEQHRDPRLLEARRLAISKRGVHPVVGRWAKKLRQSGVQGLLEKLGYRDLVWFE